MTTTWLARGPICHPWFQQPSAKRKHSVDDDDDSPPVSRGRSKSPSPPSPKRRKHTVLEAGFSSLSLTGPEPNSLSNISEPDPTDYEAMEDDVELPPTRTVLEEEQDIPEVKMKVSSWYEPEPDRIVVTSLESSDDEDEEHPADTDPDVTTLEISPALLKKILTPSQLITPAKPVTQALVLFKPLPIPEVAATENRTPLEQSEEVIEEDDAMEVEP
ncbi:hypothetical protein H0H92_008889 [Tricholoma furcatifolium]|nr:hypothetical protein H0H92_008889 [Tricholoma furcatifolium]